MSEYDNKITIVNEYSSRNEYKLNSVGTGINATHTSPQPKEHNAATPKVVSKKKRRVTVLSKVMSAMVAIVGATLVGSAVAQELSISSTIVQFVFTEQNIDAQINPEVDGFSYFMHVINYTPLGELQVAVLDKDGQRVWQAPVIQDDRRELFAEGFVPDLESGSEYTICLYDNDQLLWSRAVNTEAYQPPVSYLVENADVIYEASESGVFYSITLPEYTVVDSLSVVAIDDDGVQRVGEVYVETEENAVFAHGEIFDLAPETEYGLQILDGDRLLWEGLFTTISPAPAYEISGGVEPMLGGVYYSFTLTGYTIESTVYVRITEGEDVVQSQEIEPYWEGSALYISGETWDLSFGTTYRFYLYDGETLLWQGQFTTDSEEPIEPVYEVSVELYPMMGGVEYTILLFADEAPDNMYVQIWQGEAFIRSRDVEMEMTSDGWTAGGEMADLEFGTTYDFYFYADENLLWQGQFTTDSEEPEYNLSGGVEPMSNGVSYSFMLTGYTIESSLYVQVTESEDVVQLQDVEPDWEESALYISGEMADLEFGTTYQFYLYDGDTVLWQGPFTTETPAPEYDLSGGVEPMSNGVSYSFMLTGYTIESSLYVQVTESEDVVQSQEVEPDWEESALYISGEMADLEFGTTYQFYLYDGDTVLWQGPFTTESLENENIVVDLTPGMGGLSYHVQLYDYTVQSAITIRVYNDVDSREEEAELVEEDSSLIADGEVTDLSPETEYTFVLLDGETVLYQATFTTAD